jgi:hypothetical protein
MHTYGRVPWIHDKYPRLLDDDRPRWILVASLYLYLKVELKIKI